jgi:hypothetical protein
MTIEPRSVPLHSVRTLREADLSYQRVIFARRPSEEVLSRPMQTPLSYAQDPVRTEAW